MLWGPLEVAQQHRILLEMKYVFMEKGYTLNSYIISILEPGPLWGTLCYPNPLGTPLPACLPAGFDSEWD